ncbi:hypothetical protein [Synechocystis sp. PCC 6714]|uniref:hypothetical protein n=1 Tax=unclassified Synechocystis TaxID=2640012 RepID=UPI0004D13C80|nr:hypothetical protein D082_27160 [Synechocystis sp. PCC 6714]
MDLFLGIWEGDLAEIRYAVRQGQHCHWLRWWTESGDLLLWGSELARAEKVRADQEKQRADRLAELLRAQGIDPEGP